MTTFAFGKTRIDLPDDHTKEAWEKAKIILDIFFEEETPVHGLIENKGQRET